MHIGLLIYGSLATVSGGFLYDRQLVQVLYATGHQVEVISLPWRNYSRHLLDNWSPAVFERLRCASLDLLLQDELNHPSLAWLNARLRTRVHYPIISIVHHLRSSEDHPRYLLPLYRWVERSYLQHVDGILCNSETTRATVTALLGIQKPSYVAYPAANHRQPPPPAEVHVLIQGRAASSAPLRILFVGNVIARKGLHHLLRALARVSHDRWHLTVVGSLTSEPLYVGQIRQLVSRLHLADNVILTGAVSDGAVVAAYCESDLFVAPAYEGFGIAYLEAMSFGLPVIATTAGAAHEIVTDGQNGYLVQPEETSALSAHIDMLCRDRRLLARMSHAALNRYLAHPTWQASLTPAVAWLVQQANGGGSDAVN